jgi:apolipoprotein N-acyltransferase
MQQLGKQKSGLLLLPSGDWKAIAPYHSNAAIYRAIENGNSIFRQVNGGLSIAADYRGKILGSHDYFTPGEKLLIANVPVAHVNTLYNTIGDAFGYLCLYAFLATIFALFVKWVAVKFNRKKIFMNPAALLL